MILKKILATLGLSLFALGILHGQNTTQVYGTNGVVEVPTGRHAGKVSVGLNTNGIGAGLFYRSVDGGAVNFDWAAAGGGGTPGGTNNNVQFFNAGAFGGSNAFNAYFSGANLILSNTMGGTITLASPTTNQFFYARRAIFGPTTVTTPPEQYQDFYVKGQHATLSSFRYDSTSGETFVANYMDDSSLGGFDFYMGRPSGNPCLNIFMATGAASPIFFRGVGAHDMQFGAQAGSVASLGTFAGATFTTRTNVKTNGLDGVGMLITNYANLFPEHAVITHASSRVTAGGPLVFTASSTTYLNGGWAQTPSTNNDQFRASVLLKATNYTFFSRGIANLNRGQIRWDLINSSGQTNVTWSEDWYTAGFTDNVLKTNNFAVPVDGAYTIQGTVTNRNALSIGHIIFLEEFGFQKN